MFSHYRTSNACVQTRNVQIERLLCTQLAVTVVNIVYEFCNNGRGALTLVQRCLNAGTASSMLAQLLNSVGPVSRG